MMLPPQKKSPPDIPSGGFLFAKIPALFFVENFVEAEDVQGNDSGPRKDHKDQAACRESH